MPLVKPLIVWLPVPSFSAALALAVDQEAVPLARYCTSKLAYGEWSSRMYQVTNRLPLPGSGSNTLGL